MRVKLYTLLFLALHRVGLLGPEESQLREHVILLEVSKSTELKQKSFR
jgi:hypothetical protein